MYSLFCVTFWSRDIVLPIFFYHIKHGCFFSGPLYLVLKHILSKPPLSFNKIEIHSYKFWLYELFSLFVFFLIKKIDMKKKKKLLLSQDKQSITHSNDQQHQLCILPSLIHYTIHFSLDLCFTKTKHVYKENWHVNFWHHLESKTPTVKTTCDN
jgi:hypothetical protein